MTYDTYKVILIVLINAEN